MSLNCVYYIQILLGTFGKENGHFSCNQVPNFTEPCREHITELSENVTELRGWIFNLDF